jgi:hypothetical protein
MTPLRTEEPLGAWIAMRLKHRAILAGLALLFLGYAAFVELLWLGDPFPGGVLVELGIVALALVKLAFDWPTRRLRPVSYRSSGL